MAGAGRPKKELVLTPDERATLKRWARRRTTAQALALRSRFVAHRLDGLHDEPRPGAPRQISDDDVERVIVKTLEESPKDATHWSTRSMAKAVGMSQSAVSRIWRAFGLKPHRTDTFKLSPDPHVGGQVIVSHEEQRDVSDVGDLLQAASPPSFSIRSFSR
jgi:transposase